MKKVLGLLVAAFVLITLVAPGVGHAAAWSGYAVVAQLGQSTGSNTMVLLTDGGYGNNPVLPNNDGNGSWYTLAPDKVNQQLAMCLTAQSMGWKVWVSLPATTDGAQCNTMNLTQLP